jgi:uncharacterized membrane protein YjjB (DUF3815 family)
VNAIEKFILRRELTNMFNNALKHWKTTATGIGLALLQLILNGRSTKELALATAAIIVGAISKDWNAPTQSK